MGRRRGAKGKFVCGRSVVPGPTEDDGYVELNADELKAERILGIAM